MRTEKLNELKRALNRLKADQLKKEELLEPSFLKLSQMEGMIGDKKIIREIITKNRGYGDAMVILPLTEKGEVILTIQPRFAERKRVGIELPAGYREAGETPLEAAKRELLEETGYQASHWILLDKYYQDQGIHTGYNSCFLATGCKKVAEPNLDGDELIYHFICQYKELLELNELGYITDINSKYTMEKAKTYVKENYHEIECRKRSN